MALHYFKWGPYSTSSPRRLLNLPYGKVTSEDLESFGIIDSWFWIQYHRLVVKMLDWSNFSMKRGEFKYIFWGPNMI